MDPVTVMAACTASYNAIKAGIAVGKEIQHMAGDLAGLWDSVAKLTRMAAEPAKYTNIGASRESYEARAIELYAAKAKAQTGSRASSLNLTLCWNLLVMLRPSETITALALENTSN